MFAAMTDIYENHLMSYDWFIKADTDTYVIVENLRYLLSDYNPKQPLFFGQHFLIRVSAKEVSLVLLDVILVRQLPCHMMLNSYSTLQRYTATSNIIEQENLQTNLEFQTNFLTFRINTY